MSGRSLTTFKRDSKKIFKTSPGRWLLEKRLQQAYYLIVKKDKNHLTFTLKSALKISRTFRALSVSNLARLLQRFFQIYK